MAAAVLASTATLTACAESGLTAQDAYQVGCPAVDAAVGGGSVVNTATVAGMKALRDSDQLNPEAQRWLVAAIGAIESADPNAMPADARKLVVDGCADHGYPLRNLRSS